MQFQLTVTGDQNQISGVLAKLAGENVQTSAKTKKAAEPKSEPAVDLGFDAPAAKIEEKKKLTHDDVVAALREYAGKTNRDAAAKAVTSWGVTSVKDIKPEDYEKFIATLKA